MSENKLLFLKNEITNNNGFKKTRGFKPQEETDELEEPRSITPLRKLRLRTANAQFFTEKRQRDDQRTIENLETIDLLQIRFYTTFNVDLQKKFLQRYGLSVVEYSDFNRTVLFEVVSRIQFRTFSDHLQEMVSSPDGESYEGKPYNLLALVHNFHFFTSSSRLQTTSTYGLLMCLISSVNGAYTRQKRSLFQYLEARNANISYANETPDIVEVKDISSEAVREIVNNFDIIRTITSTRAARIRPGIYGSQRRDYGFTVDIPDNLPIVGIIDTGVGSIEPLRAAITNISYDHTGMGQHWDESGHGTLVAGLVILGQEFLKNIKGSYTAKARVATLKVIHHNTDEIDIPRLLHDIRDAKNNYGIRLFNMSLNIPTVKQYNDAFSSFAFELDKLAHELGILLFLSVGNISEERLRELTEQEPHVSHEYPNLFYCLNSNSEIHSCHSTNIQEPAESLCNISVGALAGNLEGTTNHDLTPASEYPAYYTRKFHLDFTQPVNGTELKRNQINKYLNKPDIVFEGGDLFNYDAGIEILRSPLADTEKFFGRSCGTSIATPLVTSMAAELLGTYPDLTVQSVKALLINSSQSSCGPNPPAFQNYGINLLRKLSGFGRPTHDNLIFTDDNTITFIVEDTIKVDEFNTIPIKLPAYISDTDNKLSFTLSLCYSFLPVKDNHLNYLPLHISFGIFKPLQASEMADLNTERYRIKTGITWSDDFFGVENRLFSNTQKLSFNLLAKDVRALGNEVSLAIRCTAKTEIPELHRQDLVGSDHPFSIAITISEIPTNKANNTLFAQMMADNIVENIGESEGEATIEV